ncbi:MAG: inositol monophosphatase [Rhodobacteraceae bacterium]|nr:inositol monophosphatase [Paracoccaceae bacterium]
MSDPITERLNVAKDICQRSGETALAYFRALGELTIERKGHQDLVSEADRNVELEIRAALAAAFPGDTIVGEEHAPTPGTSGYTWVIDPIDGTANFVAGIPVWTVVLACVHQGRTEVGVVHDPVHAEMFWAKRGGGAFCNAAPLRVATSEGFHDGTIGVGYSGRSKPGAIHALIREIDARGGLFYRNASGAASLAMVAAGRLLAYAEDHMNAWDYLAGQLLVHEAGGRVEEQDADAAIVNGGRVIAATPVIWDELLGICDAAF